MQAEDLVFGERMSSSALRPASSSVSARGRTRRTGTDAPDRSSRRDVGRRSCLSNGCLLGLLLLFAWVTLPAPRPAGVFRSGSLAAAGCPHFPGQPSSWLFGP